MIKYKNYLINYLNKKIKIGLNHKSGRNNLGRICVFNKISNKSKYLRIDFFRRISSFGYIWKIIKNSNRSAFIGNIIYENGLFSYIILTERLEIGLKIYSGIEYIFSKYKYLNNYELGWTYLLKNMNLFTVISNVESNPNSGFNLVRSAGLKAILTKREKNKVSLKLKSGWNMILSDKCLCVFGRVSNLNHQLNKIGKAGKNWALGKKPVVRGVAMNPCDHPHGGGEGKKSPPSAQKSPWGWMTKGTPSKKKLKDKLKKQLYKTIKK
jgi:large subunit ribosomal protein L2